MSDALFEFDFRNKRFKDASRGLTYFAKSIEEYPNLMGHALKEELRKFLVNVTTALARRHGNPWPAGTTGKTLSKRSGKAIAQLRQSVTVKGNKLDDIEGSFNGPFYLATHEYGAVIRARKSKYLTIPLPAALNADGTPKKKSARDWEGTFVFKSKAGNLIIAQNQGKDLVPLYVLKKEVKIPARLGAGDTLKAGMPYFVDKAVNRMLKEINRGK